MDGGMFASGSGEVFSKQDLTAERQKTSKVTGSRTKRKERKSKTGSQMNSQDIVRKIKLSSEMLHASDKENSETLTSLISKNRISQKVGIYSKSKASETISRSTISRRKPLEGLKLTQSAANAAKNDLRRVIGSCDSNLLAPAPSMPADSLTAPPGPSPAESLDRPPGQMEVSPPCEPPPPPPPPPPPQKPLPSLHETALRVADGLKPEQVFKCGGRLKDTKVELRKMIRQQNVCLYQLLTQCVHSGQALTPHLMPVKGPPLQRDFLPAPIPVCVPEAPRGMDCAYPAKVQAMTSLGGTELSALLGHPLPPQQSTYNPAATYQVTHHKADYSIPHLAPHNGDYDSNQTTSATVHKCSQVPADVIVHTSIQSSADFLDIVDSTTPTVWLPPVPSPSPDRPKLFPHRLY